MASILLLFTLYGGRGGRRGLKQLGRVVALQNLPSGHIAIDVLDYGPNGFVFPAEAISVGLQESVFRTSGSESDCVMLTHAPSFNSFCPRWSASLCFVVLTTERLESRGPWWMCNNHLNHEESSLGQGPHGADFGWLGGLRELMVAFGFSRESILSTFTTAARRGHHRCRVPSANEVQGRAGEGPKDMCSQSHQVECGAINMQLGSRAGTAIQDGR